VALGTPDPRLKLHRGAILIATKSDVAAGKKLVAEALKNGARFDPDMVRLAKEVGVEVAK